MPTDSSICPSPQMAAKFCRLCYDYHKKAEETKEEKYYRLRDSATAQALSAAEGCRNAFEAKDDPRRADDMKITMNACEFCKYDNPALANRVAEARSKAF